MNERELYEEIGRLYLRLRLTEKKLAEVSANSTRNAGRAAAEDLAAVIHGKVESGGEPG